MSRSDTSSVPPVFKPMLLQASRAKCFLKCCVFVAQFCTSAQTYKDVTCRVVSCSFHSWLLADVFCPLHLSLACLIAAGRHTECLKLLTDCITKSPTADRYVLRARLHKLMNQVTAAGPSYTSNLTAFTTCTQTAKGSKYNF